MLWNWLKLVRVEHSIMTFIAVLVAEAIVLNKLIFSLEFFFPAIGPALITAASFAFNDYIDYTSDKANKRFDRPIVGGLIQRKHALIASIFLYCLGLLLTLFNSTAFLIALSYALVSIAYSSYLKKLPLVGNAFVASTYAISFVYGSIVAVNAVPQLILILSGMAFSAGLSRELMNTLRDVKGDKRIGATTLPMLIGARATSYLGAICLNAAIVLSILPVSIRRSILYFFLVLITDLLFLYAMKLFLWSQSTRVLKRCRDLTLAAMIVGLLAFAALALT